MLSLADAQSLKQFFAPSAWMRSLTVPVPLGNITGAVTLNRASGARQNATLTGNVTLNVSNGSDFDGLDVWLVASGVDRTVSFHANIKLPSDSGITTPLTIESGKGCRLRFEKHGTVWCLTTVLKSYVTT